MSARLSAANLVEEGGALFGTFGSAMVAEAVAPTTEVATEVTTEVSAQVERLWSVPRQPMGRMEIQPRTKGQP